MLTALGVLMFGLVGYQLGGTGIESELAQQRLENDFEEMLAASAEQIPTPTPTDDVDRADASPPVVDDAAAGALPVTIDEPEKADGDRDESQSAVPDVGTPASLAVPVGEQRLPEFDDGSALARLVIPVIGVDDIVLAGTGVSELKKGPWHFPDTPLPGQLGNAVIAGHRTTYGAPFFDVDQLVIGDEMVVTTLEGEFVYEVSDQRIVDPSAYEVVATSDPTRASLALVSCDPKWTALNRIIVTAELNTERSGAIREPLLNYGDPAPQPMHRFRQTSTPMRTRPASPMHTIDRCRHHRSTSRERATPRVRCSKRHR